MAKYSSFAASLIFVAIVVAFAFFLNKSTTNNSSVGGQTQQENKTVETKNESKLYYFSSKSGVGEIDLYDPMTGKSKVVFTDSDEKEKIKNARSISTKGILVLMSNEAQSQGSMSNLYLIDFSGKKTKVLDNFINPQPPVISPDGNKLLLVSFNNSEKEYGFHLQIMDIASSDKKDIVTSKEGFSSYIFDNRGQSIAYSITTAQGSEIFTVLASGGTPKQIFTTPKQCYSLSWQGNEIYFTLADAGPNMANTAEIYSLFEQGGQPKEITKNNVNDNYPEVSSSGGLSYFSKDFPEGLADPRENGKIIVADLSNNGDKEVGQGLYVIGWE